MSELIAQFLVAARVGDRRFVAELSLGQAEKAKLAHENWDRLTDRDARNGL